MLNALPKMARQLPRRKSRRWTAEGINTAVNAAFTPGISFSCLEIDDDEAGSPRGGRGRHGRSLEVGLERTTARRFKADSPPRINHPNNRAVPPADSLKRIYVLYIHIHICIYIYIYNIHIREYARAYISFAPREYRMHYSETRRLAATIARDRLCISADEENRARGYRRFSICIHR